MANALFPLLLILRRRSATKPRWLWLWALVWLLSVNNCAVAAEVKDLYQVLIPVADQSPAALQQAAREGLSTLFVRVAGNRDVLADPAIKQALPQARSYLQQFRYQSVQRDGTDQLQLILDYEPTLVEQRLRFAGQPVWSGSRPSVLVWMALDRGDGKRLVSAELAPGLLTAVTENARRRGLPVQWPLMDLEDNIALSAEEVWQLDAAKAQQAGRRYRAGAVLIGYATELSSGGWLGSWQLVGQGSPQRFSGEAADINAYAAQAMDRVADYLASIYAIEPVSIATEGLLLRLQGVADFSDYARVTRYLEGLAAVRAANVIGLVDNILLIELSAEGQLQQLRQAIALDGKLVPAAAPAMAAGSVVNQPVTLEYRWAGDE